MTEPAPARRDRSHLWLGLAIFLATLVASWFFVDFVSRTGYRLERERIMSLARTTAATLESGRIAALRGDETDVGTPGFDGVRDELRRARDVNRDDFRFVYLMRPSPDDDKRMIFLADAEAPASAD